MKKHNYCAPELEFKIFANEDVITASVPVFTEKEDDDKPIELPFVPIR